MRRMPDESTEDPLYEIIDEEDDPSSTAEGEATDDVILEEIGGHFLEPLTEVHEAKEDGNLLEGFEP